MIYWQHKYSGTGAATMNRAIEIAVDRNVEYIGTEHVVAAVADSWRGVASIALRACGFDPAKMADDFDTFAPRQPPMVTMGRLPETAQHKVALEHAAKIADQHGYRCLGASHLLMGVCLAKESFGRALIASNGIDIDRLHERLVELWSPRRTPSTTDGFDPIEFGC